MKRFVIILLCAALLCGCTPKDVPATEPSEPTVPATQTQETTPADTEPAETLPPETVPQETEPAQTEPAETAPVQSVPYTIALHAAVPIFGGPSYDEIPLRVVEQDGVYTIVEEVTDAEGNRWGCLKSGAGWVDLSALDMTVPVTVAYADEPLLIDGNYIPYCWETSDYVTKVAFRAREVLKDVQLCELEPDWDRGNGYTVSRPLLVLAALEPGMPLVAELAFLGDMTAYGLTCTDADGEVHHYAVTISGRNGMLLMQEFVPGQ